MVRQPLRYLPFKKKILGLFGSPSNFKMCAGNQDEKKHHEKTMMQDN